MRTRARRCQCGTAEDVARATRGSPAPGQGEGPAARGGRAFGEGVGQLAAFAVTSLGVETVVTSTLRGFACSLTGMTMLSTPLS